MKQLFYLSVILVLTTLAVSFSKEVKSTEKGGDWFTPSTWVGSEIPCENDDIFINGEVMSNKIIKCINLTINKAGKLILNTPPKVENIINGDLNLKGCLDTDANTIIHFKGEFSKNSDCIKNLGALMFDHNY